MSVRWRDISIPLEPGMAVWPGDVEFTFSPSSRIVDGDPESCNVSHVTLSTHCGTHVDAPWHFEANGKKLDEVDTSLFFGDARLIEVPGVPMVKAEHLGDDPLPQRVLIKTANSNCRANGAFRTDFVALAEDAAERLVSDGVRLIGVDYLSVAPYRQEGQGTHHTLLQNEVFIVEGLMLADFGPGTYPFVVLPLPLTGADGAPCRAFIGEETTSE